MIAHTLRTALLSAALATTALATAGLATVGLAGIAATPALAQEMRTVTSKATFEDARFELNNAIVNRGLTIDYTGHIGDMLKRTGKDVGSEKPIYKSAQYLTFCSAKLSRQMMEADPANIGYCPYVVFIYETVGKPGVVIGYRVPAKAKASPATKAALAEIDKMLAGIIKDAAK